MDTQTTMPPAGPTRVCPHCHAQSQTVGKKCPHCGKKFKKRGFAAKLLIALVVLMVLGIGGCATLIGGAANEIDKAVKESERNDPDNAGSKPTDTGRVGEEVSVAGTKYTVKSVKTSKTAGFDDRSDGTFVIVQLQILNTKDETKTFDESAANLRAADGTKYEPAQVFTDKTLFLKDMQPDLPTTGEIIFDVPPAKAKGARLQISDLFGDGYVEVALGL
jgi:hypothetical protein